MQTILNRIEQPISQKNNAKGTPFEIAFDIPESTANTFENTVGKSLPENVKAASEKLIQQENTVKEKMGILKLVSDTLADPKNTGKADRITQLIKQMSAYEIATLMQDADNIN